MSFRRLVFANVTWFNNKDFYVDSQVAIKGFIEHNEVTPSWEPGLYNIEDNDIVFLGDFNTQPLPLP